MWNLYLSVCLSVCLSVTLWYCVYTVERMTKRVHRLVGGDLQPWARAVCTFPAVPRSTQPSTLYVGR